MSASLVRPRRQVAAVLGSAAALWPALGWACPQCAGRAEGGIAQWLALGAFVTFPFAVALVVMRFIKRGDGSAEPRRPFS